MFWAGFSIKAKGEQPCPNPKKRRDPGSGWLRNSKEVSLFGLHLSGGGTPFQVGFTKNSFDLNFLGDWPIFEETDA